MNTSTNKTNSLIYDGTITSNSINSNNSSSTSLNNGVSKTKTSSSVSSSSSRSINDLSNINSSVYDNCCFLLYCSEHHQVLLTKGTIKFLPFAQLVPHKTWQESSIDSALQLLLGNISPQEFENYRKNLPFRRFSMSHLFRFQLPQSQKFITRLTYIVEIDPCSKVKCCNNYSNLQWHSLDDAAQSRIPNVWGPEVSYFANVVTRNIGVPNPLIEYSLNDAFKYALEHPDRSQDEKELVALLTNLAVNDIERLYADFIEHCFPSFFFTRDSFQVYMQRHEIETRSKVIQRYYSAFRIRGKHYLQFTELLLGLAAIDIRTTHADARLKLVFRYYDYDKDGCLNVNEFRRLLGHVMQRPSERVVRSEMTKIGISIVNGKEVIRYEHFKRAVGSHQFRGTSSLCRANVSPFAQITRSLAGRKMYQTINASLKNILANRTFLDKCPSCLELKPYELASNEVLFNPDGLWAKSKQIYSVNVKHNYSVDVTFNHDSVLHFLMGKIRQFNKQKGTPKSFRGLYWNATPIQMKVFMDEVENICHDVGRLVEQEERVLQLPDSTYVIGDIHGNLEDLLTLEQTLWRRFPMLTSNYLFLGDFVDRGKWGFEVFLYLMILKLICPGKVYLLRGNHEVRPIQMKYSFHKELSKKYGSQQGQILFDFYNYVFDRLPFCAVINHSIFCAHGGIPFSNISLYTLNTRTPHVLSNPEQEAINVWEMLWSDPLEYAKFEETAIALGMTITTNNSTYMYLPNRKRGTSYLFNEYAVLAFLRFNQLQFIVRAHEVPADGFKFNFGRLCTTVFSCSHYCRNENECAVLLIEPEARIRVIRIDTSGNHAAMFDS
ncbi:hypothetical protein RDWZM_009577 [Blomia tropicalis]|uniref:Serine/threonine-protein phosphatase n=2 Tax=Blomia tropicalis TaxID=40697 RepID=A0A9Q0M6U8_BLOTA|nr:hypothetical protein RDWZM_009577 [Blomia tropicalis]